MAKNKRAIKAKFLELLPIFQGNVQGTISEMGKTRETRICRVQLYRWKNEDKEFSNEWDRIIDDSRQQIKEGLISALIRAGLEGNVGAIALYFKLVEGWVERKDHAPAHDDREDTIRLWHALKPEERKVQFKILEGNLRKILKVEPDNIEMDPGNVKVDSGNVEVDPDNVKVDPEDIR